MLLSFALALALQVAPQAPVPETVFTDETPLIDMIASRDGTQVFTRTWGTLTAIDLKSRDVDWTHIKVPIEIPKNPLPQGDLIPKYLPARLLAVTEDHLMVGSNVMIPSYTPYDLKTGVASTSQTGTAFNKTASCMLTHKKGTWVWFGITLAGLQRLTVGNVNGWSQRKTILEDLRLALLKCLKGDFFKVRSILIRIFFDFS
ncbi:MAG: hypothetical protein JKY61_04810, partial [Planctomycetes bacterium]|nr:hypothetical protein [Planctomycetota bacterium]